MYKKQQKNFLWVLKHAQCYSIEKERKMRVNLTTNNILASNQQNFGRVDYGGESAVGVRKAIKQKFGKAASDALELLEQQHGQNEASLIRVAFDPKNNTVRCNAALCADNVQSPVKGFPRAAQSLEGVLNLINGAARELTKLTTELGRKIQAIGTDIDMYPAPLVSGRLAKEAAIPEWRGVKQVAIG